MDKLSDEIKLKPVDNIIYINVSAIDKVLAHFGYDEIEFMGMVDETIEKEE